MVYFLDNKKLFLLVLLIIIILIIIKSIVNTFNNIVFFQHNKNFRVKRHVSNRLSIIICFRSVCSGL